MNVKFMPILQWTSAKRSFYEPVGYPGKPIPMAAVCQVLPYSFTCELVERPPWSSLRRKRALNLAALTHTIDPKKPYAYLNCLPVSGHSIAEFQFRLCCDTCLNRYDEAAVQLASDKS
jgi:hypothetical protein